jgi:hypothetical protein
MWPRAIAAWFAILCVAVLSGGIRDRLVRPRYGNLTAEIFGAAILSLAIVAAAFWIMPRWSISPGWLALLWLTITEAFEFLFFHYVGGHSWGELLAAYRFWEGRLWIVVLATIVVAPFFARAVERGRTH